MYRSLHIRVLYSFPTRRSSDLGELMREHAHQLGALTVCAETEVIDVEVSGGRVTRVVTDRGEIETESVVLACGDRKSTRLNSSHVAISYAFFFLKKK